jgi:hypothetical protein
MHRLLTGMSLALALLVAGSAKARCPAAPADVVLEAGVCSMRLTWTIPTPGQVTNVIIRRGPNSTFSASIPIATVSPLVPFHIDTPPQSATNYTYWVVFLPADAQCPAAVSEARSGRPYQSGTAAPQITSATSTCASVVTITASTVFDATAYGLVRKAPGETGFTQVGPTQPTPVFVDTTPGAAGLFEYGVLPVGACGAANVFFLREVFVNGPPTVVAPPSRTITYDGLTTLGFGINVGDAGGTRTLFRNGVPIIGPTQSLTPSYAYFIASATYDDAGSYFLRVTTPCGTVDSPVVVVAVLAKPCAVDFNDNNARDIDDVFIFLNAWFAGCP